MENETLDIDVEDEMEEVANANVRHATAEDENVDFVDFVDFTDGELSNYKDTIVHIRGKDRKVRLVIPDAFTTMTVFGDDDALLAKSIAKEMISEGESELSTEEINKKARLKVLEMADGDFSEIINKNKVREDKILLNFYLIPKFTDCGEESCIEVSELSQDVRDAFVSAYEFNVNGGVGTQRVYDTFQEDKQD